MPGRGLIDGTSLRILALFAAASTPVVVRVGPVAGTSL